MKYFASAVIVLLSIPSAHALIVGADGRITDWGITPFSDWGPPANTISNGGTDNNWSPVDYPSGVGHRPSPGGVTGELFDLEGLYARHDGDNFEALLITSMPLYTTITAGGYHYRLGDLFLDSDNDGTYELALITQDSNNRGFAGGQLRKVSGTYGVIAHDSGYGGYPGITAQVNPWALESGALLATGTLNSAFYANYAGGTEPTWIYEWSVPFSALDLPAGQTIKLHMTVECGNDLIEVSGTPLSQPPPIPEPTTLVLAASALAALVRRTRGWCTR
jgi:hypothetical protein